MTATIVQTSLDGVQDAERFDVPLADVFPAVFRHHRTDEREPLQQVRGRENAGA
jgi:hypothetical protein